MPPHPSGNFQEYNFKLEPYYQYGLTATPFRKGNDEKLIFISLGEIIAEVKTNDIENYKRPRIVISNTSFQVPFNPKTDPFETLSKMLIHDSARNKLILKDVTGQLNQGRKAVILTERKEHIEALNQFLKQSFETVTLSGEDSETSRKAKWKILDEGHYQALITTGQFFGEGTDLQNASCLFLTYPFSFKGKLIQYIGRVQRAEITPIIFDYRDIHIDYLNRLFLKRNKHYRHFDKQDTLFAEIENIQDTSKIVTINKPIKVLIDQLDFRYGAATFTFSVPEVRAELEFEIENDDLRPEFDVLKYFFTKALKSKHIDVDIFAEFENGVLVAQSANSIAIEKINQEIIEGVKFRFLEKDVLGKRYLPDSGETLLDFHGILETPNHQSVYTSEDDLLHTLLSKKKCKHYKQLRFLASRHDGTAMKLRFVLNPFAFVFLLPGHEHFHLVLETYDTEEATYIWHLQKDTQVLKKKLKDIDQDLSIIRSMGRQFFLESNPDNFSRIIHDYADHRKGFILWKSLLEERLT
jgi:superfamily II DNA or RNA helicase